MTATTDKRSLLGRIGVVLRGSALLMFSGALLVLGLGSLLITTCVGLISSGENQGRGVWSEPMLQQWLVLGGTASAIGIAIGAGWLMRLAVAESTRKKLAGVAPAEVAPRTVARLRVWLTGFVVAGVGLTAVAIATSPLPFEYPLVAGVVATVPGILALVLLQATPRLRALDLTMALPFHWAIAGLWPAAAHPQRLLLERPPIQIAGPPRFLVAATIGVVVYALARQVRNALGREDRDRVFFLVVVLVLLEWGVGFLLGPP
jgi:hypothetical protein